MKSFKDYLKETAEMKAINTLLEKFNGNIEDIIVSRTEADTKFILEHKVYQDIPGASLSYRFDNPRKNSKGDFLGQPHVHVYAKPKGNGKELYSINADGSGHDGSSGKKVHPYVADHFRGHGFNIKPDNILECVDIALVTPQNYTIVRVQILSE